ncbi:hypothetical protein [Klebsiella pneumoniae]|uniref:hypothetical protein n=1 Tax=Klebsiella pneumoniae TaxID=573 RepID=UPI0022F3F8FB|nr:hypothetical protein [Klebsiella pneumoniae]WBX45439.1 hypothetical protein MWR71_30135 [Klebsiella pneumoniae]
MNEAESGTVGITAAILTCPVPELPEDNDYHPVPKTEDIKGLGELKRGDPKT